MSIFPTKILLATDGSEEAELALNTAVDIAAKTGSELHVVHIGHLLSSYIALATPLAPEISETTAPQGVVNQLFTSETNWGFTTIGDNDNGANNSVGHKKVAERLTTKPSEKQVLVSGIASCLWKRSDGHKHLFSPQGGHERR